MPSTWNPNARLVAALAVSAAVVLSAPFLGQFRAYLRAAFPEQFVAIVGAAVALALAGATAIAVARIRYARALRYAVIVAAVGAAVAYALATQSGTPEVDVVERVHFIEYGAIAFLFYLAFRPLGDPTIVILPVLAALTVGTLDEWLQWFIPNRVGEARDVFLNLVAIGSGLAFAAALEPPAAFTLRMQPRSRRTAAVAGVVFTLVFAGFVNAVHLGHLVADGGLAFRSHYRLEELQQLSRERAERWRSDPPRTLQRLSREDQYLDEGLWHVRERNLRWAAADYDVAYLENEILERYFKPVIDTRSYAAPEPSRWPAAQRADAAGRAKPRADFVSQAEPYPIVTLWGPRRWQFWSLVVALVVAMLSYGYRDAARAGAKGNVIHT
jgi:VanZ family protein